MAWALRVVSPYHSSQSIIVASFCPSTVWFFNFFSSRGCIASSLSPVSLCSELLYLPMKRENRRGDWNLNWEKHWFGTFFFRRGLLMALCLGDVHKSRTTKYRRQECSPKKSSNPSNFWLHNLRTSSCMNLQPFRKFLIEILSSPFNNHFVKLRLVSWCGSLESPSKTLLHTFSSVWFVYCEPCTYIIHEYRRGSSYKRGWEAFTSDNFFK